MVVSNISRGERAPGPRNSRDMLKKRRNACPDAEPRSMNNDLIVRQTSVAGHNNMRKGEVDHYLRRRRVRKTMY
jgi:hypothetical protein